MQHLQEKILSDLDYYVSICGLIAGLVIASLYLKSNTVYLLTFGIALFLASGLYLLNRRNEAFAKKKIMGLDIPNRYFDILFFILFSLCILSLYNGGGRTIEYFILFSVMCGVLACSIINSISKDNTPFHIIKILIVSFLANFSIYILSAGSGIDYWEHLRMNSFLSQSGDINVLFFKEIFFPLMHIQVALGQIIGNIPIREASSIFITVPYLISAICVFLIGRKLFDDTIGLLGMLIVSISDYHIAWGIGPQTTTFGIALFYFLLMLVFYFRDAGQKNKLNYTFLVILLSFSIIFSHAVSSFITIIAICSIFFGSFMYKIIFRGEDGLLLSVWILIIYLIFLIQHWFDAIYHGTTGNSFFEVVLSSLQYYINGYADFLNRPESIAQYSVQLPHLLDRILDSSGITLLIFLSVIGVLFWLSSGYRNRYTIPIIVSTVTLMTITFGFPLFGLRNILPTRWFVFFYFFLGLLAAFSIVRFQNFFTKKIIKLFLTATIISVLTFFMITCTIANTGNPLWLKESTVSTTYSVQEIHGAETLSRFSDRFVSDYFFGISVMGDYYSKSTIPITDTGNLTQISGRIFIWRDYMFEHPIPIEKNLPGYYKSISIDTILGDEIYQKLQRNSKIFENGRMSGYFSE
jgi:hypothetical protein